MAGYGGYPPASGSGLGGLVERLGERALRRAEPRFGVALAGVGVVMIVIGIIAWAGEQAAPGDEGDSNRTLGIILSLLVIAAGYLLVLRFRHGPLAAAGVAAATLGVPVLMGFVTFDATPESDSDAFFVLPFAVDAIVLLSLAAWLVTYVWAPTISGRVFFLAASAFVLWLYLLEKVEEGAAGYVLTLPYSVFFFELAASFDEIGDGDSDVPDFTTIGGPSLVIGIVYYLLALLLDRKGYRGIATPLVAAGFLATVVGIGHLAGDLEATGTGVVLILAGSALALYGATQGRRFTTWTWAAGAGLGVLVILGDAFEDSVAGFGGTAIVLGAGIVLAAHLVADRFGEPDEMAPGPSRFTPRPPRSPQPPAGAWSGGGYPQQVPGASWAPPPGSVFTAPASTPPPGPPPPPPAAPPTTPTHAPPTEAPPTQPPSAPPSPPIEPRRSEPPQPT